MLTTIFRSFYNMFHLTMSWDVLGLKMVIHTHSQLPGPKEAAGRGGLASFQHLPIPLENNREPHRFGDGLGMVWGVSSRFWESAFIVLLRAAHTTCSKSRISGSYFRILVSLTISRGLGRHTYALLHACHAVFSHDKSAGTSGCSSFPAMQLACL